jgi:5-keto 4-deoxyuronate isomerase
MWKIFPKSNKIKYSLWYLELSVVNIGKKGSVKVDQQTQTLSIRKRIRGEKR